MNIKDTLALHCTATFRYSDFQSGLLHFQSYIYLLISDNTLQFSDSVSIW